MKIKSIKLQTAEGKYLELSLKEAKELYDNLDELFGKKFIPTPPTHIEKAPTIPFPKWSGDTIFL